MSDRNYVELVLACKSWQEAQAATDALLERNLASTIETLEVATNYVKRYTTGQMHYVKLIIQTSESDVNAVKRCIRELRNSGNHPPYVVTRASLPRLVTKWLRGVTEVKSDTLR